MQDIITTMRAHTFGSWVIELSMIWRPLTMCEGLDIPKSSIFEISNMIPHMPISIDMFARPSSSWFLGMLINLGAEVPTRR